MQVIITIMIIMATVILIMIMIRLVTMRIITCVHIQATPRVLDARALTRAVC